MRKMILSILTLLLTVFFSGYASPEENSVEKSFYKTFFSNIAPNEVTKLLADGRIDRYPADAEDFLYMPDISQKNTIISEIKKRKFNIAAESLFFFHYPDSSSLSNDTASDYTEVLEKSLDILTAVETLAGIKYYSVSHKGEKTLFTSSRITSGGKSVNNSFKPQAFSLTALIEDTTFGKNRYDILYETDDTTIQMKMSNSDRLTLGFIPVTGKDELVFRLVLIPSEEGLYLYCCGTAKTLDSGFIRRRIGQSVYNRITALYNWFYANYTGIDKDTTGQSG